MTLSKQKKEELDNNFISFHTGYAAYNSNKQAFVFLDASTCTADTAACCCCCFLPILSPQNTSPIAFEHMKSFAKQL